MKLEWVMSESLWSYLGRLKGLAEGISGFDYLVTHSFPHLPHVSPSFHHYSLNPCPPG